MVKTYWKSEYNEKQWKNVIDEALRLGCKVEYSKYGNTCVIDSTDMETKLLVSENIDTNNSRYRCMWAEHIHERIQRAAM